MGECVVWEDPAVCELGTGKGWQLPSVGTWRFPQYPCVWDSSHTGLLPRLAGSAVPPPSANKDTSQIGQCQVTLVSAGTAHFQQRFPSKGRACPALSHLLPLSPGNRVPVAERKAGPTAPQEIAPWSRRPQWPGLCPSPPITDSAADLQAVQRPHPP